MEENNPVQLPLQSPTPVSTTISHPSNGKLITVLLFLIFFSPVGLILMWVFMKDWPTSAKRIVTLIYIVLLIVVVGLQFYLAFYVASTDPFQKLKDAEALNEKNMQMLTPTPTPDPTANWKMYTNSKYSFTFQYPSNFAILAQNDIDAQFLLSIKSEKEEYALDIGPLKKGYVKYPLNAQPTGTQTIGKTSWEILPPKTFCDAGECGETNLMYQTNNAMYRYDFSMQNPATPTATFTQILSTFTFTQ